jgi:hypothetical protein
MDDTPNLNLPYIMAAQAQKHVTHNEAIRVLDAILQIGVADRDLTTPPSSPAEGASYIVATGGTGAWLGKDLSIAAWQDGAWAFYPPREGWLAWVADEDLLLAWDGTVWIHAAGATASAFTDLSDVPASYSGAAGSIAVVKSDETGLEFSDEMPLLGINATADTTNKLAIASDASLFNHAGAGHQHKINKNAAGETASVLFQTGFSGRAEFGTTGDDDFHVKVSADGSTWAEAAVIDKDTGYIGVGTASPLQRLHIYGNAAGGGITGLQITDALNALSNVLIGALKSADGTYVLAGIWMGSNALSAAFDNYVFGLDEGGLGGTIFNAPGTNNISFRVANDTKMMVSGSNGNVGINTTSPAVKLDVNGPLRVKSYTVSGAPSASAANGQIIYVSDESGGAVLAFSDGTNWRRVTDRAVIS